MYHIADSMKKLLSIAFIIFTLFLPFKPAFAQDSPQIDFFYSETCPHCRAEQKFLNDLQVKYPGLTINRYAVKEKQNQDLLIQKAREIGKADIVGVVPITFVGGKVFVGFDNAGGVGAQIEAALGQPEKINADNDKDTTTLPVLGAVNLKNYSLPALAIILGLLDGVNICSLGALALILGLVLALRDRKKIFLFGGVFILTTALVYGMLILFWHRLFVYLASFTTTLELFIGVIGIVSGYFLFREFLAMKKAGVSCKFGNVGIVKKVTRTVQKAFDERASLISVLAAILAFAAVITIVEFPCSAAIPVVFAGILADNNLGFFAYFGLIALFVLFYLLDELIVYIIAVTKMSMWLGNPKFMTYAVLLESLLLMGIGVYYLGSILGF